MYVTSTVLASVLLCLVIFVKIDPKDLVKRKTQQEEPLLGIINPIS